MKNLVILCNKLINNNLFGFCCAGYLMTSFPFVFQFLMEQPLQGNVT